MELKDFIEAAVVGITSAVDELKNELKDKGTQSLTEFSRIATGFSPIKNTLG